MQELVAIEQNIRQGTAFANKADDYLDKANHNQEKANQCRKSSGKHFAAAQDLCRFASLTWTKEFKRIQEEVRAAGGKPVAIRTATGNMKIARADDPDAALEEERAATAEGVRNHRENSDNRHYNGDVMPISQTSGVEFSDVVYLRRSETVLDFTKDEDTRAAEEPVLSEERDWGTEVRERDATIVKLEARIKELEKELGQVELERDNALDRIEELESQLGFTAT